MPEFKIYIRTYDLKNSLIHFVVWKTQQDGAILFGDLHIPTYKLFIEESGHPKEQNQEIH